MAWYESGEVDYGFHNGWDIYPVQKKYGLAKGGYDSDTGKTYDRIAIIRCTDLPYANAPVYYVLCTDGTTITNHTGEDYSAQVVNQYVNEGNSKIMYCTYDWNSSTPSAWTFDQAINVGEIYDTDPSPSGYVQLYYGFSADVPIYTVNGASNSDFAKINNYIETGDDSEADNAQDLHPVELHTKIWLDGAYPQVYVKTTVTQGEYSGTITCKVVANVESQNPQQMMLKEFHTNSVDYIPFGDYGQAEITDYEFEFCRSDIFSDLIEMAKWTCSDRFILSNIGEIVGEEPHDSLNGHHTIEVEYGVPSDEDYEDTETEWNHEKVTNGFSGANTLTQTYKFDDTKLRTLGNFLWSSTFKDNIFSLTNCPLDNIVSLKAMPVLIPTGEPVDVKIGNVTAPITAGKVTVAEGYETTVGEAIIPRVFHNFVDYSEFNLMIYLPFIGFKPLDTMLCMGRKIRVKYYFDVILGNCLATIEYQDSKNRYLLHDIFQANCGVDIAITATNRAQIENGYINTGLSVVNDLLNLNPIGAMQDAFNGMTQQFRTQSNGVGNPSLMNKLDMKCFVFVKRPQKYKPNQYGHVVGIPRYEYKRIGTLTGFVKCKNFICSRITDATDKEKEEINRLMNDGVFVNMSD